MSDPALAELISAFRTSSDFKSKVEILKTIEALNPPLEVLNECRAANDTLGIQIMLDGMIKAATRAGKAATTPVGPRQPIATTLPATEPIFPAPVEAGATDDPGVALQATDPSVLETLIEQEDFHCTVCVVGPQVQALIFKALYNQSGVETIDGIAMWPLSSGFSGAAVYRVYPLVGKVRLPRPWIAKVGPIDKLKREFANVKRAKLSSATVECHLEPSGELACLLQSVASATHELPNSLKDLIWPGLRKARRQEPIPPSGLASHIERLGAIFTSWNPPVAASVSLAEAFAPVLEQIKPEILLSRLGLYGLRGGETHFPPGTCGATESIINPIEYYRRLLDASITLRCELWHIHGDLHCGNIQIDQYQIVHLIDWGNSGHAHYLLDYAALEVSIFSQCLPTGLPLAELLALLSQLDDAVPEPTDNFNLVARVLFVLSRIRDKRQDIGTQEWGDQYWLCIFVCAVQQLQYEDIPLAPVLALAHHAAIKVDSVYDLLAK